MSEESDPDVAVSRDMTPTQTFRDRLRHAREKGRASSVPLQSISLAPSLAGSDPGTVPVQLFASLTEDAPHEQPKGESQGLRQQPRFGIPENESHHTFVTTAEAEQHQQPAFVSPHDLQLFDASESITVNPSDVFNRPETELHLPSQSNVPAAEPMTTGEEQAQHHTADEDDLSLSISDNDFAQEHRINLGDSEYAIPLPMDSRIRDEYDSLIENNRSAIAVFLKKTDPRSMEEDDNADSGQDTEKSRLTQQMITMIDRLNNICTHPDLNRPSTAIDKDATTESKWAEYQGSKFKFLGRLIHAASTEAMHIIIFSKPGKSMHLVETFLLGRNFIRNSSVANEANIPQELSFSKIDLSFGLRSTADETMRVPFAPPSLIIALDATFNPNNPSVYSLRSTYSAADGQLTPVIRLIIAKSSEHIERCLPPADGMEALRFLVQHTEELSEIYSPYNESNDFQSDDAERVVQFVNSKASRRRWHLPYMSPPEEWIQTEEEEQSHDNHPTLTIGEKRPLAAECDAEAKTAKKRKIASSWHEIIRLSGTTKKKSTSRPSQALKTSTVDSVTAKPDTIIQQLRSELAESRSSLTRYQSEFARLQHRYETKHNDYHKMRQSLNASLDSNKRLEHELQRLKQDNAALRDERVGLRNDLEALKEIKKSEDQMQRDLIEAKEEAAKLQKENASLKRQTDQERSQAEYTRIQYQNASSAAAKAAMENKQLEDRIKLLQDQMAGRALELKQMRLNNNEKVHLARIAELEALLDSRERMLGIREEELRELKKNRPSTRATSIQPRSVARSHSPGGYGSNGHSNGSGTGPSLKGPSNILRYR